MPLNCIYFIFEEHLQLRGFIHSGQNPTFHTHEMDEWQRTLLADVVSGSSFTTHVMSPRIHRLKIEVLYMHH